MRFSVQSVFSLLMALVLLATLSACGSAQAPAATPSAQPSAAPTAKPTVQPAETPAPIPEEPEETSYLDISGIDFSSPDISIAYDDYEGMYDLAKKMQNFEIPADTVVEIDGEVGSAMMSHTIVVPNAAGDQRVGTTYEVIGGEDLEFPPDETRIHIIGVVRMNESYFNVLVVPAELFTVAEG